MILISLINMAVYRTLINMIVYISYTIDNDSNKPNNYGCVFFLITN